MPRGKTRTRSTSKARLGSSTSGKTSTILSSVSPSKSSKRQTICTEKNGKVMCQTVDKQTRTMSPAGKRRLARKQAKCAVAEKFGVGQCDQDGDLWYNEDMIPEHTEIDENGNVVRMLYVDPEYIVRLRDDDYNAAFMNLFSNDNIKVQAAIAKLRGLQTQRVNPDKLKGAYIVTKEEVRHKKMLLQYLVCLANQDAMNDEVENQIGALYGGDLKSFSRRMMEMQILRRIMDAVQAARTAGRPLCTGREIAGLAYARSGDVPMGDGALSFETDNRYNFKKATWKYSDSKSVTVHVPEELASALREQFLLDKLVNDKDANICQWITLLLKGDVISGATMSKDLIGAILLYTSVGPDLLGISEFDANCAVNLFSEKQPQLVVDTRDGINSPPQPGRGNVYNPELRVGSEVVGAGSRQAALRRFATREDANKFVENARKAQADAEQKANNEPNNALADLERAQARVNTQEAEEIARAEIARLEAESRAIANTPRSGVNPPGGAS